MSNDDIIPVSYTHLFVDFIIGGNRKPHTAVAEYRHPLAAEISVLHAILHSAV